MTSSLKLQSSHRHTQLKADQWHCGSVPMQIPSPRWLGVELPFQSEGISQNTLCCKHPCYTNTHTHFPVTSKKSLHIKESVPFVLTALCNKYGLLPHACSSVKCFQLGSQTGKIIPQVRKRNCCLCWWIKESLRGNPWDNCGCNIMWWDTLSVRLSISPSLARSSHKIEKHLANTVADNQWLILCLVLHILWA